MIQLKELDAQGIVIAHPEGPLSTQDFDLMDHFLGKYIKSHQTKTKLLIHSELFPGWTSPSSFYKHLEFIQKYKDKTHKIAVVTNSYVGAIAPYMAKWLTGIEVKHFSIKDEDQAIHWLNNKLA
jgi:SpoIIAA-like